MVVQPGDRGEHAVTDPPARDGRGPGHPAGRGVKAFQPVQEQVGEVGGDVVGAVGLGHELFGVEGVPAGAVQDAPDRCLGNVLRVAGMDQPAHAFLGERRQRQPDDAGYSGPFDQRRTQRMAPVQVVGAVGHHDGDPLAEHAGEQEPDQVAGGGIGPVHVFEHEHDRSRLAQPDQCGEYGREQVGQLQRTGRVGFGPDEAALREKAVDGWQVGA